MADLADDLADPVKLGERGAHDAARGAKLKSELALRGQSFARPDAALVDLPLEHGVQLVDLPPGPSPLAA